MEREVLHPICCGWNNYFLPHSVSQAAAPRLGLRRHRGVWWELKGDLVKLMG